MAEGPLKKRDLYLNTLIAFQDRGPAKIVTGIRRCGKSSLLKLTAAYLQDTGVAEEQIISMNLESHDFHDMTSNAFYEYVLSRIVPGKRMYFFV